MKPFSIVCKSCAARLKVTKASAVGQVLACPKCGTMIRVAAPEGWIAPKPAEVSDSQISNSDLFGSGSLGGDFEDIENILAKPQPANPQRPKHTSQPSQPAARAKGNHAASKGSRQSQPKGPGAPVRKPTKATDQPILPNDQWTGEATRKRKRMVLTIVGALGALLIVGAIATAIILNLSKSSNEIASNDSTKVVGSGDSVNPDKINDSSSNPGVANGPPENAPQPNDPETGQNTSANPLVNQNSDSGPDSTVDAPINNDLAISSDPPEIPTIINHPDDNSETDPANAPTNPLQIPDAAPTTGPPTNVQSPFDGIEENQDPGSPFKVEPPSAKPTVPTGIVEELENDLGELANLLEDRGSSLSDLKDLAAQINQQPIGLPKYVVTPVDPLNLDLEKQLDYPVGGLKFESAPLVYVIRNISTISGIPISIDVRSIITAGKDPTPEITGTIADTNVAGALEQILNPLGLTTFTYPGGIVIGFSGSQELANAKFELPEIPNSKQDDLNRFVATIREFVSPEDWVRDENPATIELVDNTVVVNCSREMQFQIERLISKLSSAHVLIQEPNDANAIADIQSRWKSIAPLLAKDPSLSHSIQMEIGSFLNKLKSRTGVSLLVDWPSVATEGWTPQLLVPGNIEEPTVLDTATQLAQSMRLAIVAVNEDTLLLTTLDRSSQMTDLEVYPVSKILAGGVNENQLMTLINNALGSQLQSRFVRFAYQPSCQCVIVLGPQTLQRQIEALLDQLDGI